MKRLALHTNIRRHERIQPLRSRLRHVLLRHRLRSPTTAHTHLPKLLRHARDTALLRVPRRRGLVSSLRSAISWLLSIRSLSLSIRVRESRLRLTIGRLLGHAICGLLRCLLAWVAICGGGGRCLTAYDTWRSCAALGSICALAKFIGLSSISSLLLRRSSCRRRRSVLLVVAAVFGVLLAVLVGVRHGCGEVGAPGSGEALLTDGTRAAEALQELNRYVVESLQRCYCV